MNRKRAIFSFLIFLVLCPFVAGEVAAEEISVMSFNIWYPSLSDPRSLDVIRIIKDHAPDVAGLQEFTLVDFKNYAKAQLESEGYNVYMEDTASHSTPKGIFFKRSRFILIDRGSFDLVHDEYYRTALWVKLRDLKTWRVLFIVNSHWSNTSQNAKIASAQILRDKIAELAGDLPKIVLGDFNATPDTTEIGIIKDRAGLNLVDADSSNRNTYHAFTGVGIKDIDYILASTELTGISYTVITTAYGGNYPSDHFPIKASFMLPSSAPSPLMPIFDYLLTEE